MCAARGKPADDAFCDMLIVRAAGARAKTGENGGFFSCILFTGLL